MSNPYRKSTNSYKSFSGNNTPNKNCYKIQNINNEYDKVSQKDKDEIKTENDIDTETLKQDFPDTYNYIISEIDRLKSLDSSINNLQALNLAIGSNCGSTNNYELCPVRRQVPTHQPTPNNESNNSQEQPNTQPTSQEQPNTQPTSQEQSNRQPNTQLTSQEQPKLQQKTFKEKGNCVGEGCKVQFNNTKNLSSKIKELNIDFYSNDRCGFCKRSKDLFKSENVISNMNVIDNKKLPNGANGYPHFHSNTTGKSHTGAPSTVKMLVDKLS